MIRTTIQTRRDFLTRGLGLVGLGTGLPNFLIRSAQAGGPAGHRDRVVVALLLTGGHDGLSEVPPFAHEDYYRHRKATRVEEKDVLKLNGEVGLHPALKGFRDLLDRRAFSVVLGTGYPSFDLSHFVSRDIWEAARPGVTTGKAGGTGWLGRYIDHAFPDDPDPKLGLAVGPGRLPLVVTGTKHPGIGFSSPDSFRFTGARTDKEQALYHRLNELPGGAAYRDDLQFVTQTAVHANESSQAILDLVSSYQTDVTYPDT